MKRFNYILIISLFILDRIIKEAVKYKNIVLIANILSISYVENSGIAFGFMNRYNNNIILINLILIILLFIYLSGMNITSRKDFIYSSFILAGSIGNIIDRLFYGYVIDYISILDFPIFNLADIYIVFGLLLLFIEINRVGECANIWKY